MTAHSRGDVVLVGFVFAEGTGKKLRPAVVISTASYHRRRQDVIVAAITSNVKRRLFGDHLIEGWKAAGLLFASMATAIVRTIKQTTIDRRLGTMPRRDLEAIDRQLRQYLGL